MRVVRMVSEAKAPGIARGYADGHPVVRNGIAVKKQWISYLAELTTPDGITETQEWNQVNWKKLLRRLYKLQKRIYQASPAW